MSRNSHDSIFASRRAMLKAAGGCSLMSSTSMLSTLLNLQATKAAVAAGDPGGYKAIVCLFLFGGNDSYNTLAPYDGDTSSGEYGDYSTVRGGYDDGTNNPGGLALNRDTLIPVTGPNGRTFGFHEGMASQARYVAGSDTDVEAFVADDPGMSGAASLYNDGKLAVMANVGSLIERTTRATYDSRSNLPLGLFSHSDLQRHWMTGVPNTRSQQTGWGGRLADMLLSTNDNETVSMNISVNGMNLFQTGGAVVPYAIGSGGATTVSGYTSTGRQDLVLRQSYDSILQQTYGDLLAKSFAEQTLNSIEAAIDFNNATNAVEINTPFFDETPSNQLKMVARCIGARQALQQTRQVFFVSLGGFDMHGNLITGHQTRLPQVSRAIKSFYDAMADMGCENDVTLFTASDFARTLGTNGQGSDHAWGGLHWICGGAVDGGKVYGQYPDSLLTPTYDLATDERNNDSRVLGLDMDFGNLNLGRGRLIPTMAVDEYAAELAMWFGIPNNQELVDVLPNIRTFFAADNNSTTGPLGVLT